MRRTLAIIKPDAVERRLVGRVLSRIEEDGFNILEMRMLKLEKMDAEDFYHIHRERPFFDSLTSYMSSGPVVVLLLERDDAVNRLREIMGATDPEKAEPGTIRREFAVNVEKNSIHGSDSEESAEMEIAFFSRALGIGQKRF